MCSSVAAKSPATCFRGADRLSKMKQQGQRRHGQQLGSAGIFQQQNCSPSSERPNKHSRVSGPPPPPLLIPENRMRNNEDAAARGSVPTTSPPSSQRGAEECTNKSIRNEDEVNANDNASEAAEIGQRCQVSPRPQEEQGSQVAEERRRTTTIVTAETADDLRWIYCRERGCTFWTRKPGTKIQSNL